MPKVDEKKVEELKQKAKANTPKGTIQETLYGSHLENQRAAGSLENL